MEETALDKSNSNHNLQINKLLREAKKSDPNLNSFKKGTISEPSQDGTRVIKSIFSSKDGK